jgi:phosphoribosyl isomerase A
VTTLVIGSETLESVAVLKEIVAESPGRSVLSLDFRGDEFLGPEELLADPSLWPHQVIVMTLTRIGSGEGPDVARIRDIARRSGGRRVYAAGGMRHRIDLDAVRAAGASGALIASALHGQKITAEDLLEITGR